jgi:Zn-dependent protease
VLGSPALEKLPLRHRTPLTIGRGGIAPALLLAGVFMLVSLPAGLPLLLAAAVGAFGGTASLLIHELGHVRAALRLDGVRAASVSLIWLGAATRIEGAYATGREQTEVALAGPRASLRLALILAVAAIYLPLPLAPSLLVFGLALFNVALALLNLLPAYPLDGHKLVVGLLWSWTGSEQKARRLIRRVGMAWMAGELAMSAALLVEKPVIGITASAFAAVFYGQKLYGRMHSRKS